MDRHYLLADVARILNRRPHQITYALTTRQVAEPTLRVANKRVFCTEDVEQLARYFKVSPRWPSANPAAEDHVQAERSKSLLLKPPFGAVQAGEGAHEVRDGDGNVYCWATDRAKALILAGLLESAVRG
jgi:hypothetical protein